MRSGSIEQTIAGWMAQVHELRVELTDNPNEMARANLLMFHAPDDQREGMSDSALVTFVTEASRHLSARPEGVVAYWWYDWQAGHLRMSLAPSPAADLPFQAAIQVFSAPGPVVMEFLSDHHRERPDWPGWDGVVRVYVGLSTFASADAGPLPTTSRMS